MSKLEQRRSISCPLAQAEMRLRHFFREHGNAEGDTAKLAVGIDFDVPGLAVPLSLERSVIVTVRAHRLPADMEPRYAVAWAPETPGPFPLFSGELIVEGGEDYNSFVLCLHGNYTPPLGILGKSFDAVVGNRVAGATAERFLSRIRDEVERNFAADEAQKHPAEPFGES